MSSKREIIIKRAARLLKDGELVNLGIGMPTLVAQYIPKEINITLQTENGFIGVGPKATPDNYDKDIIDAGGGYSSILPGGMFFDSAYSFALIRGGHVTSSILGALQVDECGNLANWIIPGKLVPGMGGAMDLVTGARTVIITMEHTDSKGNPKILKKCTLPLTAAQAVDYIVTELCLIKRTDKGLELLEVAPGVSVDDVLSKTEAALVIPDDGVGCMEKE